MPPPKFTKKYSSKPVYEKDLAKVFRERTDPEVIVEWLDLLLAGHGDARIVPDGRTGGYRAEGNEKGGRESTFEQKQWALKFRIERGFGLPEQSTKLEASIEARLLNVHTDLSPTALGGISYEARERLFASLSDVLGLGAGESPEDAEIVAPSEVQSEDDE